MLNKTHRAPPRYKISDFFSSLLKMRREYGPSYFAKKMSGLAAAAKQIAKEEKAMASQPMTEKIQ